MSAELTSNCLADPVGNDSLREGEINMAVRKMGQGDAERDLMEALEKRDTPAPAKQECLRHELLEDFAAGRIHDQQTQELVVAHVRRCRNCMAPIIAAKRKDAGSPVRRYPTLIRRRVLALIAAVLLVAILWRWYAQKSHQVPDITIVDLRADVTRGTDSIKVPHNQKHLLIILPSGNAEGVYELDLIKAQQSGPLLHAQGVARAQSNGNEELRVDVNFGQIATGYYLLAISHGDSKTLYQPVQVE